MIKKVLLIGFICFSIFCEAQQSINDYKYILVPKKFDIAKVDNEYNLNELTKFLFNKYGYKAYFLDEDLPEDLLKERCLALTAELSKKSSIFKTKIKINLKDCFGNTIITSAEGESRIKKLDRAHNEALRSAFETFKNIGYKYVQKSETKAVTTTPQESKTSDTEVVEEKPEKTDNEVKVPVVKENDEGSLYYAQTIKDGYQLVDAQPKVIMILINTSAKDVFMVKSKNAIVYKENNEWVYFENNDGAITKNIINIKF